MKKSIIILVCLLFLYGCSESGSESESETYAIGDTGPSGVGIVFYITAGGVHGLEAAPSDWNGVTTDDIASIWSAVATASAGTSTAIGTGLANSNSIIAQPGHTSGAAKLCRNYHGGGYTDWFLPSKNELNQLYVNRSAVDDFIFGGSEYYWSSSEDGTGTAWFQSLTDPGFSDTGGKDETWYVRPVRAF